MPHISEDTTVETSESIGVLREGDEGSRVASTSDSNLEA